MAITITALAADFNIGDQTMTVASGTGFPAAGTIANPGYLVRINGELMWAIQQPQTNVIRIILRGFNGTTARNHDTLSKVEVSAAPSDFASPSAGTSTLLPAYLPIYQSLGEDTTFTSAQVAAWGNQPQNFALVKATAIAVVLVAPSKAQDGLTVTFTSTVNVLDAITATALLANGFTASPYTTATKTDTKIGGAIVLQAQNGLWNVVSNLGWLLS